MVDGFEEISPQYKETVLDMLEVLKQISLKQLCVTTRPHLREELEDNLQQLSYTLQPFSKVEQVEFLKKFWDQTSNIEVTNQQRLQIYAEALIRKLAQSISDRHRQFTGIPLQTRMLAEAFEEKFKSFYVSEKPEPELTDKLDLLELYGGFIERKYNIYYEEKSKIQEGNLAADRIRENDSEIVKLKHQLLALAALFTEDQVTFLKNYRLPKWPDEELPRFGIVQRNSEGKLHFIHRTFAEYFVAEFLINELREETEQNEKVQEILLNVVLLEEDCKIIRAFLDALLKKSKPTKETLREYGEKLSGMWYERKVHAQPVVTKEALHQAAEEDNVCIIEFILEIIKSGGSLSAVTKQLLAKDHHGRTAWQYAAEKGHVEVLDKLWEWANELQIKPDEIRNEVLLSKDKYNETAWQKATRKGHVKVLDKLWGWAKELQLKPEVLRNEVLLSKEEYNETVWQKAAQIGNVEVLQKLWDWAKELQLKPEELRNEVLLSKGYFNTTAWHEAVERGNVEVLEKLWDWAKELQLNQEELRNEVLLSKDEYNETAWHKMAKIGKVELLEKLWDWAKELQLKPEELRNGVLLSKDRYNETAWQRAAKFGNVKVLEKLWDWAKELQLNPEELRNEVLLSKDRYNETAWQRAAKFGNVEVLEKLWNWAKAVQLKPEELRNEMLLSKDRYNETAWHKAAEFGNVELLVKLWDWAKELQLHPEELRNEVLLSKDRYNRTAWQKAAKFGNVELLEKLWDWAKELQLKPEEFRIEVLLSKD
jgi:ankyrin repeat protein